MRSRPFAMKLAWAFCCVVLMTSVATAVFDQAEQRKEMHFRLQPSEVGQASVGEATPPVFVDRELEDAVQRLLAPVSETPGEASISVGVMAERARVVRSTAGYVESFGAPAGRPVPLSMPQQDAATAARMFLREHARAFGVVRQGTSFAQTQVKMEQHRRYVRLRQRFNEIPVFGAGVVVQLDAEGNVEFALVDIGRDNANFHRTSFDTQPSVPLESARDFALGLLRAEQGANDLEATDPELMIYEPSVIGNAGPSRLVWHVQVTSDGFPVNEIVLVDAQAEGVAFRFSQIMEDKSRRIYDANNVPGSLGILVRSELGPPTGIADVDAAYDFFGDTYDFYYGRFDRDGLDGAGSNMIGRVRYCPDSLNCPYANAFWNGTEMRFGAGYADADDVVAHELTHGVTSNESNLIYWGESGAINEALSDIFGEFVDLTNSAGTDTLGVRWLVGEDLPGGAIRDMSDPPAYGDPDRRMSTLWHTSATDNRGVHINSGVANKLAYLLTDGDTFNGRTVAGLGIDEVAALFYEAQTNLLVPAADYHDLYAVLDQAAVNLSWLPDQRDSLERACQATEIAVPGTVQTVFADDFEGAFPGGWAIVDLGGTSGTGVGTRWGRSTYRAASGTGSAWCASGGVSAQPAGGNYVNNMNTWMKYGPFSLSNANDAWAAFDLYLDSEAGYDGIIWGVSNNGTDFYGFSLSGYLGDWIHEVLNFQQVTSINTLGRPQVWFAFAFTSDGSVTEEGAYVDNFFLKKTAGLSPFGSFDTPVDQTTGITGAIAVTGWALDDTEVEKVEILRDPVSGEGPNRIYVGDADLVGGTRPDVEGVYPQYPFNYRAGWGYMLLTNMLPNQGNGTYTLHAIATDNEGHTTDLGSKRITADNANATKPFGTIDTPTQGGTASGMYRNWGWALAPQGDIPDDVDGSTISVWVDGVRVGNVSFGLERSDIQSLFPGYADTDTAVHYFDLDTTAYANGVHTILWIAADGEDPPNADGLGSRFFQIANPGSSTPDER